MNTNQNPPPAFLAMQLERAGRFAEAEAVLQKALATHALTPDLASQLARLALRRSDYDAAVNYWQSCLKENPGDPLRRANLGAMYLRTNRPDKALNHLLIADKKEPNRREILQNIVQAYFLMGRPELAIRTCERLCRLGHEDAEILIDLAKCYDVSGDSRAACDLYDRALNIDPRSVEAYDGWARSQRFESVPDRVADIERLLGEAGLAPNDRFVLHLAVGKILDDVARYDEAFEHFRAGNASRQSENIGVFEQRVQEMERTFTKDYFAGKSEFGVPSNRPIFIVGMPRSGTTLVEQILASHPHAYGANEIPFIGDAIRNIRAKEGQSFGWAHTLSKRRVDEIGEEYLELLKAFSGRARRVTDKMPQNFEHLWFIALAFPNAAVVHCVRDPMDTCFSCFTNPLGLLHMAGDLASLGRFCRLYQRLMEHWRTALPIKILDVRYESLVSRPEEEIGKLLEHVGLEWHDACLHPELTKRAVRTPSRWQVRREINSDSVARWRRYEKHLGPLQQALLEPQ